MKRNLSKAFVCALLVLGIALSFCVPALGAEASTPERHGYTTITESDVKYVYDLLLTEVGKSTPTAKIVFDSSKSISKSEMEKAIALFISDYPEFFWFRNHYSYLPSGNKILHITPTYSFSGSALTEARNAFNNAVSEIMGGLPSGSNYDKALYLHDALAKRVEYVQTGEHQTAYGALVSGKAVCAGYAAAYQLLLREAGIKAWTVTGHSQKPGSTVQIAHAWNVVWLDSDTCVYTDVTWNDQSDDIYRYYFNLSRSEMDVDHLTNTDIFTLPACNHDSESYFDVNNATVNDSTTPQALAALFGPTVDGKRSAVIYYTGSDLNAWLDENSDSIYTALDGGVGRYTYSYGAMGKEIHLCFEGNFPTTAYTVSIWGGGHMFTYGEEYQLVTIGQPMTELVYTASAGYYFPEDYSVASVKGVSVTRISSSQIKISGTPTGNVVISLPAPVAMPKEATPTAAFRATGADCGVLSGVESGMKYSTDGENWIDITSSEDIELTGLSEGNIYVIRTGNGVTTYDSERQTLTLTKPSAPALTVTQPTAVGGKGSINTDSTHEYSTDGESWTSCTGALTELDAGKYYVRVRANGSALASEAQELTVSEYGQAPSQSGNDSNGSLPNSGQTGDTDSDSNGGDSALDVTPDSEDDNNDTGKATAKKDNSAFNVNFGCGLTLGSGGAVLLITVLFTVLPLLKRKKTFDDVK